MDSALTLRAAQIAARALRRNLTRLGGERPRVVLSAGQGQFRSVWTRDFCFAAGGLLAAGETTAVRDTLTLILEHQRADGLLPRLLDWRFSGTRFLRAIFRGWIPLRAPLAANFTSDHFVAAIDSNALVCAAAARYAIAGDDPAWAGLVLPRLERAMRWYDERLVAGLVAQPRFSDWKDTVGARAGRVFFTQVLYWRALSAMADLHAFLGRARSAADWKSRARAFQRQATRAFWLPAGGFFADTLTRPRFSADGNLAAAAWGFCGEEDAARILRALDRAGLSTPWGPRAAEPYPLAGKSGLAVLAGVAGYQDDFVWLWTSALLMRTLSRLGREGLRDKLTAAVARRLVDTGRVAEIYHPESGAEVRTWLYRSEHPFSWSAGMLLEAFAQAPRRKQAA